MSDCGLLLAKRCGTINGRDLASVEVQPPLCSRGLDVHSPGMSHTRRRLPPAVRLIRRSGGVMLRTSEEMLVGCRWWTEMRRQAGPCKHEQQKFKARWGLCFCPLPSCQVNAIGLFYKWDYSCWHFQCTSYTSSSSSSWLLILYMVSLKLCKAPSRTMSGGVSQIQVIINIKKQRLWHQIQTHYRVNTNIILFLKKNSSEKKNH